MDNTFVEKKEKRKLHGAGWNPYLYVVRLGYINNDIGNYIFWFVQEFLYKCQYHLAGYYKRDL